MLTASPRKDTGAVALPNSGELKRGDSCPAEIQTTQKTWSVSQIQRHEKPDHTFRNVLLFLLFAALLIFAVDLYK
jgi:hypothetical protein